MKIGQMIEGVIVMGGGGDERNPEQIEKDRIEIEQMKKQYELDLKRFKAEQKLFEAKVEAELAELEREEELQKERHETDMLEEEQNQEELTGSKPRGGDESEASGRCACEHLDGDPFGYAMSDVTDDEGNPDSGSGEVVIHVEENKDGTWNIEGENIPNSIVDKTFIHRDSEDGDADSGELSPSGDRDLPVNEAERHADF